MTTKKCSSTPSFQQQKREGGREASVVKSSCCSNRQQHQQQQKPLPPLLQLLQAAAAAAAAGSSSRRLDRAGAPREQTGPPGQSGVKVQRPTFIFWHGDGGRESDARQLDLGRLVAAVTALLLLKAAHRLLTLDSQHSANGASIRLPAAVSAAARRSLIGGLPPPSPTMWGPWSRSVHLILLLVCSLTVRNVAGFRGSNAFLSSNLALLPCTRAAVCSSSSTRSGASSSVIGDKARGVSPSCLCSLNAVTPTAAGRSGAPAAAATAPADVAAATAASEGASEERFPFQAEVKRVLDIIVHSLYTDKDVFLRELVSNAADACDKKRVLLQEQQQKQQQQQEQQQEWKGSIRVYADKTAGTLTIEDDGIGMSRQELIDHLGTIAQSGTYKFAQHLQQQQQQHEHGDVQSASDLIGQFGVGFYSAFLVADKVEVISSRWQPPVATATADGKANAAGDKSLIPEIWKWSSSCGQTFSVEKVDAAEEQRRWEQQTRELHRQLQEQAAKAANSTIPAEQRQQQQQQQDALLQQQLGKPWTGTRVVLHLREDCDDYLEDYRLKELLKKYSEFLPVPIYLLGERVEYERVQDTSEAATAGGGGPKFKTVTNRFSEWTLLNTQAPIWRRSEDTLTEKDYVDFYKATFKAYDDPLAFLHMSVEGQVSFRALLYVPGSLPWELSRNMFDEDSRGIRLYVRRVFINDKFQEAVPRWLTFIRGVVDSDDLPLNVGREILQKSQMLRVVHKRVAAKAVEMIQAIKKQGPEKWGRFWENYGKYLKIGAVEDRDQQEALASLVQLHSTHSRTMSTTLDEYIARAEARNRSIEAGQHEPLPDGSPAKKQKAIYYLAAESRRAAEDSPALEGLKARGFEVVFGVEPLDEFFLASLSISQFKGWPVIDINKADLQLDADEAPSSASPPTSPAEQQKQLEPTELATKRIELGGLVEWLQQTLGPRVHNVVLSSRLRMHPAVLVQGQMGLSPTMQRYMQQQAAAQGVSDQKLFGASLNQPILEINPTHPITQQLDSMEESELQHYPSPPPLPTHLQNPGEQQLLLLSVVRADPTSERAKALALELLAVASLQGGYSLEDPGGFAKAVIELLRREADRYLNERK
ncbi:hypothetical protein Emed_001232 [Eimeria media]